MGLTFSSLLNSFASLVRWSKDQDIRILMLGLDSAGKVGSMNWHRSATSYVSLVHADDDTIPVAGMRFRISKMSRLIFPSKIGEVVSTIPSEYRQSR